MSRVFIVDDDPSVLKASARVMRAAGFEAATFASAADYLAQFDPCAAGCLVLDLTMPGVTGLQLQRELAVRGGAPAIVFLSGHAGAAHSAEAMNAGAVQFLTKPVDAATLIAAVRSALARSAARAQTA